MNIFPKIRIGKTTIKVILFLCLIFLFILIYTGAVQIIYTLPGCEQLLVYEKDFWLFMSIPAVLGFLIGWAFCSSFKSWDKIDFVHRVENRIEALQIQVLLHEHMKDKGWKLFEEIDSLGEGKK